MKKRILASLLSFLLIFLLIPTDAFAAEITEKTAKVDLTNCADTDASDTGWSWDASEKTLTLTEFTLVDDNNYTYGIYLPQYTNDDTITIILEGNNYISGFDSAIRIKGSTYPVPNLMMTSNGTLKGSLTISDCTNFMPGQVRDLTIDGITVTADTLKGLTTIGTLIVKNGAVVDIAATDTARGRYAIYSCGGVKITDSTVTATSESASNSAAIALQDGSLQIENSIVTVNSSNNWGFYCFGKTGDASASVKDSTLNVNSATGIYAPTSITLSGDVEILTDDNRQVLRSASIITDDLGDDADIQGYARQGDNLYYLTDYTLTTDFAVDSGQTLTIPEGVTLTLADNVTLSSADSGTITNNGTIVVPCENTAAQTALESAINSTTSTGDVDEEHSYSEPTFTWAEDGSSCTAKFICASCDDTETLTATVASEVKTAATCTEQGVTTYTASVTFNGTTFMDTKDVTDISATGHSYITEVVAPTYAEQGYILHTCDICGDSYQTDVTAILIIDGTDSNVSTQTTVQVLTELPEGLKNLYSSVDELISDLISRVVAVGTGYTEDNTLVYDVVLQYSTDGGTTWITATVDNFPSTGITVTLPYPDETDSSYEFVVEHMFTVTSERLGITAGDTERPTVTKTEDGLVVTLMGLSPVAVSWKAVKTAATETETTDTSAASTVSSQTGDNSPVALWLALLSMSGAGVIGAAAYNRKRKYSR